MEYTLSLVEKKRDILSNVFINIDIFEIENTTTFA